MTNKEREIKRRKSKKELLAIKKDYDKMIAGATGKRLKKPKPKTQTAIAKKRKIPTGKIPKSDVDKLSKAFKKYKPRASKSVGKKIMKKGVKALGRSLPGVAAVLTGAEIAKGAVKGAKKIGKSLKARKACTEKGGIYSKGFCITGVRRKSKKSGSKVRDTISKR
tara:strand:- start:1792 stop:2286 length:495 start_codon:yes stop_codon:yes gene_type:complete